MLPVSPCAATQGENSLHTPSTKSAASPCTVSPFNVLSPNTQPAAEDSAASSEKNPESSFHATAKTFIHDAQPVASVVASLNTLLRCAQSQDNDIQSCSHVLGLVGSNYSPAAGRVPKLWCAANGEANKDAWNPDVQGVFEHRPSSRVPSLCRVQKRRLLLR